MKTLFYSVFAGWLLLTGNIAGQVTAHSFYEAKIKERYIAIDNVCAWPNLTMLNDGTIIATIFNKPSHGLSEGDVECWATRNGRLWQKAGIAAPHDSALTNRMNVAVGLAKNGDLLVLCSGWLLKPAEVPNPARASIIPAWISHSSDGGKNWLVDKKSFPSAESGRTEYIPFGDVCTADDGSLRASCYSIISGSEGNRATSNHTFMFRSNDHGHTWTRMSTISTAHNETALFHAGKGSWLAVARGGNTASLDLFRSVDDGQTWQMQQPLSDRSQVPAHLLRLKSGQLLLTYGNRLKGDYGIKAKVSDDNGDTWSREITLIDDLTGSDCGYPSSVQLPDGEILTAYYASGTNTHDRYHMGTVIWSLKEKTQE